MSLNGCWSDVECWDAWGCANEKDKKEKEGEKVLGILGFYFSFQGYNRIFIFIIAYVKNIWRCRKKQLKGCSV